MDDAAGSDSPPQVFAPRPLRTSLWGAGPVDVFDYVTGAGIAPQPSSTLTLAGIDADAWLSSIATSLDALLTDEFFAAVEVVDGLERTGRLAGVRAQQARLASELSLLMYAVLDGTAGAKAAVPVALSEAFRERLLNGLANLYATQAALMVADSTPVLLGPEAARDVNGAVVASVGYWLANGVAVDVPLPARPYPAQPVPRAQTADASDAVATVDDIKRWAYGCSYVLPFHDPRDVVHGSTVFAPPAERTQSDTVRSGSNGIAGMDGFAEFILVFAAVCADLERLLPAVVRPTEPDPDTVEDAGIALDALVELMWRLDISAAGAAPFEARPDEREASDSTSVAWSIAEEVGADGELVVTLDVSRDGGIPLEAFTVSVGGGGELVPQALPGNAGSSRRFNYTIAGSDPVRRLDAVRGQRIPERALRISGLDLMQRPRALATFSLVRNPSLAAQFVYRTPEVRFADDVRPRWDIDSRLDLGKAPAPIRTQLGALFDEVLEHVTARSLGVMVSIAYVHDVGAQGAEGTRAAVPLLVQPMLDVVLRDPQPGEIGAGAMIESWQNAVVDWFDAYRPAPGGALQFDLQLFAASETPFPLLRLRQAELPLALIDPPLATAP